MARDDHAVEPGEPGTRAAKTVEVQSIVTLPAKATLKATVKTVKKKNSVLLSGTVTANGAPVSGASVAIFAARRRSPR